MNDNLALLAKRLVVLLQGKVLQTPLSVSNSFQTEIVAFWPLSDRRKEIVDCLGYSDPAPEIRTYLWEENFVYTCLLRAESTLKTLLDWCVLFRSKIEREEEVRFRYFILNLFDLEIDYLKYHSLCMAYRGLKALYGLIDCDPPLKPSWDKNLPGMLGDLYLQRQLCQRTTVGRSKSKLVVSLLLDLKRGFPSMKETLVEKKIDEYHLKMCKPLQADEELLGEVGRTCAEIYGPGGVTPVARTYQISKRAGIGAPVKDGGIFSFIRRRLGPLTGRSDNLVGFTYDAYSGAREIYSFDESVVFQACWDLSISKVLKDLESYSEVEVSPIYEPLKIRLITKGDPFLYSLMIPFQRGLWRGLQKFEIFQLTGNQVTEERVQKMMGRGEGEVIVSGDYKAATDSFSMEYTKRAFDVAFSGISEKGRQILYRAIGPQVYRRRDGSTIGTQVRGQLMGSPLSFPILCLLNAALVRLAFERVYRRFFALDDLPVLINGDDILFRGNVEVYQEWKRLTKLFGWELSPGKSFASAGFAQINSTTFPIEWTEDRKIIVRKPIERANMGWLEGTGKDVRQIDEGDVSSFVHNLQNQDEEFSGLSGSFGIRVRSLWEKTLESFSTRLNRILPYELTDIHLPWGFGGLTGRRGFFGGLVFDGFTPAMHFNHQRMTTVDGRVEMEDQKLECCGNGVFMMGHSRFMYEGIRIAESIGKSQVGYGSMFILDRILMNFREVASAKAESPLPVVIDSTWTFSDYRDVGSRMGWF
jgi:hypothetical protein